MINLDNLKLKNETRQKTGFYASDFSKSNLDLYFAFTNEPITNPPQWYESLKWGAGKGVEEQMLTILKDNGFVKQDYDQKEHGRIDLSINNIEIHGYIDAWHVNDYPIEIKSINNKNEFDIRNYENGYPRENYVGQLGIYMKAREIEVGALFVASIDGLNYWMFDAYYKDGKVKCGNIEVDIDKEIERWSYLWDRNIATKTMPDIWELKYKYPIEEIDWKSLSKSKITSARNNHSVIGDWQILYSPWKNKIIELQGEHLGYNNDELSRIKELTDGYTTWKK